MSFNWHPDVGAGSGESSRPALPQDDFADEALVTELEPRARGGQRALLYPAEVPAQEAATQWLAAPAESLVDLGEHR